VRLIHLALGGALACGTVVLGCADSSEPADAPAQAQAQAPAGGPGGPQGRTETFDERRPGTTEVRPGQWRAPEFDPPSILDYDPNSMLVTEENLVPAAKFPVIDIHSHQRATDENMERLIGEMDAMNVQVLVNLSGQSGDELRERVETIRNGPYPDRFRVFANVDFDDVGPGWGEAAAAQLRADVEAGAIGLKVFKSLGMTNLKADGSRLQVDDPELDPVWAMAGEMDIPVLIHTAEPPAFFEEPDYTNERWLELALFPSRRNYGPDQVDFETLLQERDRMFLKHPNTRFIAAHFGFHGHDLQRAAEVLDSIPNLYLDLSAVLYDFGRQPRAAREFFIEYQDRLIFGKDSYQPTEFPYYWRVFETADEYFDYYRDYHAYWKLYGMDLPDDVLQKIYYENALAVTPGLPSGAYGG
jgi:predicted TIM-barrel fold metal-dependent hydrolase